MEKRKGLIDECRRIEENAMYTSDSHYKVYSKAKAQGMLMKVLAAVSGTVSGLLVVAGAPIWVAWMPY